LNFARRRPLTTAFGLLLVALLAMWIWCECAVHRFETVESEIQRVVANARELPGPHILDLRELATPAWEHVIAYGPYARPRSELIEDEYKNAGCLPFEFGSHMDEMFGMLVFVRGRAVVGYAMVSRALANTDSIGNRSPMKREDCSFTITANRTKSGQTSVVIE
jgi:hypothetical protein